MKTMHPKIAAEMAAFEDTEMDCISKDMGKGKDIILTVLTSGTLRGWRLRLALFSAWQRARSQLEN